jgi:CubicO group peptidase (beta-lactamase class C family)
MLRFFLSIISLLVITAAFIFPGNFTCAQNSKPTKSIEASFGEKLDAEIKQFVDKGFSGAVLVARNHKITLNKTYGNAANYGANPAFWIASNSKSFVAAAILKLQEQKKLSVNDPLVKFFNDVPADKQQITIHHLLTHTSGLPHKYAADGVTEREKAVKAILSLPLGWKVGEGYHYSNDGYNLLAAIVEISSKRTFEDFTRKEILNRVKLDNSGLWGYENNANLTPVANVRNTEKIGPSIYKAGKSAVNWGFRGATGIYSTTEDVYKWMLALEKNKILNQTSREQLWGKQALMSQISPTEEHFYGYGWGVRFKNGKRIYVRHTGDEDWLGHNAVMCLYENGDAYVVLSNSGAPNDEMNWSSSVSRALQKQLQP